MDLQPAIAKLETQLQQIIQQQQSNQQQQIEVKQQIEDLDQQLQIYLKRQRELDNEAINLFEQKEQLEQKIAKIRQIYRISEEFRQLQQEFKDDRQLLDTLYNAMIFADVEPPPIDVQDNQDPFNYQANEWLFKSNQGGVGSIVTVEQIKATLPDAEIIHQQIGDRYLETYQSYRNLLVEQLDLIWCTVAFIAFDRSLYVQLSRKYHPDMGGSAQKMQLVNAAWEIYQDWRKFT